MIHIHEGIWSWSIMTTTLRLLTLQEGDGSRFLYITHHFLYLSMLHAVACGKEMLFFAWQVLFPSNVIFRHTLICSSATSFGHKVACSIYIIYGMHPMIAYLHRIQDSRNEKDQESTGRRITEERKDCIILAEQYTHGWLQYKMTSLWYTALELKLQIEHSWSVPLVCSICFPID